MQLENLPPLLKISEVAKILSLTTWTLRQWDKKGILKPIRIGSRKDRRYRKEDILKLIEQNKDE